MAATSPAFTGNLKKALAGLRRINLDGLRWRVFDAKGQVLGRLASQIAVALQGKDKPTYAPHVENGDMCIVLNAKDISVTGRKMTDKIYYWHTGYIGHLKERRLKDQMEKDPTEVIRKAVLRMLPRNRLRDPHFHSNENGNSEVLHHKMNPTHLISTSQPDSGGFITKEQAFPGVRELVFCRLFHFIHFSSSHSPCSSHQSSLSSSWILPVVGGNRRG